MRHDVAVLVTLLVVVATRADARDELVPSRRRVRAALERIIVEVLPEMPSSVARAVEHRSDGSLLVELRTCAQSLDVGVLGVASGEDARSRRTALWFVDVHVGEPSPFGRAAEHG